MIHNPMFEKDLAEKSVYRFSSTISQNFLCCLSPIRRGLVLHEEVGFITGLSLGIHFFLNLFQHIFIVCVYAYSRRIALYFTFYKMTNRNNSR